MLPLIPPVSISRMWLLAMVAVAAVTALAADQPLSSFAAGFAAGAGIVFVLASVMGRERDDGTGGAS
ncbi:MAG: hypothetical protein ABR576_17025 [Thermoanaerobaculia bacterium]